MNHLPSTGGRRSGRLSAAFVVVATALLLAAPTKALAQGANFTARLDAPDHTPTAGSYWYIALTATRGRVKLNGRVDYEFLSGGQVVSRHKGHAFSGGSFKDKLCFPALAVGQVLTLGVLITTKYGERTLHWTVVTRRGAVTSPCKVSP